MRISQTAARRLPLRAVPGRSRHRACAEATGRHRRGGDRRVRGQARDGASREQSRPGPLAVERPAEAAGDCCILVAAAGPGAARRARVGAPAIRQWLEIPPLLASHSQSRRAISGSRASAFQTRCRAPYGAERPVKGDGYRRRSKPLTGRAVPPRCCLGWRPRHPPISTIPTLSATSPRSTTAGAIPDRAASTPNPHHGSARHRGKCLPVSRNTSFKHLINMK